MDLRGARLYAVNDRPVALVRTASGGEDCVVFDWDSGDLVPDRSYFERVIPGVGKDVDALTPEQFRARVAECRVESGTLRVDRIRALARRLCATNGGLAEVMAAVGLSEWRPDGNGEVPVDPPRGFVSMAVRSPSARFADVRLRPAGPLVTRALLDAGLGPASELPTPPEGFGITLLGYAVGVAAAASVCRISVEFRGGPALAILLRPVPRVERPALGSA